MDGRRSSRRRIAAFALLAIGLSAVAFAGKSVRDERDGLGVLFDRLGKREKPHRPKPKQSDAIERWNSIAIDASGLDHTPLAPGETRVFGEQLGPTRASRAMAIVQIAVFEALNAIEPRFESYVGLRPVNDKRGNDRKGNDDEGNDKKISAPAAIASAAHDTLVQLFPSQAPDFDELLAEDLDSIRKDDERQRGVELGRRAAAAILARRANDGSNHREPRIGIEFIPGNAPGDWRQDPISQIPIALGALWGGVTPFALRSAAQFRSPPPPDLDSPEYTAAFDEAKRLGGDGKPGGTPTQRTAEQTFIGIFWAYDGTPSLCAPPRLYNQIALEIARQQGTKGVQLARLLALLNVAMADAGIAIWDSKFTYQFWRPITAIREADPGTGPLHPPEGDGNHDTVGDPGFTPLGAPASNLNGPDFTPPFPAYPSGHAGFGGAIFETLREFYGTDRIPFSFVSDEFNGETRASDGSVRPLRPRSFQSLSQAEEENGQSRIYLGIHWAFDKTEGIAQGRKVAAHVFATVFRPLKDR